MHIPPITPQGKKNGLKTEPASSLDLNRQLKDLFFELKNSVLLIDFQKRQVIEANIWAEKNLGYEAGEMNGLNTDILYLDQHVYEQIGKVGENLLARFRSTSLFSTVKKKDGTLLTVEALILPFREKDSGQYKCIVIAQLPGNEDQSDLSARYQVMAQTTRDIVLFIQESDGKIIDANRIAVSAYGYSYNELLEMNISQLGSGDNAGIKFGRKLYSAEIIHEALHRRKDGSTFPVEISLQDQWVKNEQMLVCTIRDATVRFEAETARRLSEDRYRLLFNSIMDGFALCEIVYDLDGKPLDYRLIEVNPAFYALFDLNVEVTGKRAKEIFTAEEIGPLELYERVARTGIPAYFEYPYQRLDKQLDVMAFCPLRGQFATIISDITARKKAEAEISRQLQRLEALRLVDSAIATSFNLQIVIKILVDQIMLKLGADAVDLLMLNVYNQTFEYETARGFRNSDLEYTSIRDDDGLILRMMEKNEPVVMFDLVLSPENFNKKRCKELSDEKFVSYCGMPILIKGRLRAVLETFFRTPFKPDDDWLSYLNTLANQAAIAIDNTEMFEGLQRSTVELTRSYEATLESWARSVIKKTGEEDFHTYQVTQMTMRLARRLGMGDEEIVYLRRGAILHDIGKLGIPDQILQKPGALTSEEWTVMRQAPVIAYEFISHIQHLMPAMDIPYAHHEHWDGSGYPLGLKKNTIPLAARIFAVVEAWNVMHSDRPYRKAWSDQAVKDYIWDQSGLQFDPVVVEEFFKMLNESGDK